MKKTFTLGIESEGRFGLFHRFAYFIISEESMHGMPMLRRSKILALATSFDAAEQQSVTTIVL